VVGLLDGCFRFRYQRTLIENPLESVVPMTPTGAWPTREWLAGFLGRFHAKALTNPSAWDEAVDELEVRLLSALESREASLRTELKVCGEALNRAQRFIDVTVRRWAPSEHTNCGIDSGCSHRAYEMEIFEAIEREVALALDVLTRPHVAEARK
jgi:hypothetical protein